MAMSRNEPADGTKESAHRLQNEQFSFVCLSLVVAFHILGIETTRQFNTAQLLREPPKGVSL